MDLILILILTLITLVPDCLGDVQEMIEGVAHQEPPFKAYSATHPSLITDRHQTAHWFGNTFDRHPPWSLGFFAKEREQGSEGIGFEACEMLVIIRGLMMRCNTPVNFMRTWMSIHTHSDSISGLKIRRVARIIEQIYKMPFHTRTLQYTHIQTFIHIIALYMLCAQVSKWNSVYKMRFRPIDPEIFLHQRTRHGNRYTWRKKYITHTHTNIDIYNTQNKTHLHSCIFTNRFITPIIHQQAQHQTLQQQHSIHRCRCVSVKPWSIHMDLILILILTLITLVPWLPRRCTGNDWGGRPPRASF